MLLKRSRLLVILLLVALTAATPLVALAQISGPFATVGANGANGYAGPGVGFWVVGRLRANAIVPVVGVNASKTFWQVETPFGKVWVAASAVRATGANDVPVVNPGVIGTVTAARAAVRNGPGTGASQLAVLRRGQQFFIVGRLPDATWLEIRYEFGTGWVSAALTDSKAAAAEVPQTSSGPRATVNASFINVRSGPGIGFTSIGRLRGGDVVPIIGKNSDGSWLLVETRFGNGWVNIGVVTTADYFGNAPVIGEDSSKAGKASLAAITRTTVNLRKGPSVAFDSLGTIAGSTQLTILGQSADKGWWYVESPIGKGWVSKAVVSVTGDTSGVPVVQ
jgi:uncharacterized protein YraI